MSEVMPSVSVPVQPLSAVEAFRALAPRPYEELQGVEPVNDVEQLPFVSESKQLSLVERIGDKVLYAASLAQVKVADTVDHLKQEGGKIAAHAALAGLAVVGAAGLMAKESGKAEASGGPNSRPGVSISYGWNVYVNFNWAATQKIEHFQEAYGTSMSLGGMACGLIPGPVKFVCMGSAAVDTGEFGWAIRNAQENNDCFQYKIPYEALSGYPSPRMLQNDFGWAPCKS